MILIYRSRPSDSARELVEALANCRRYRDNSTRPPRNGDKIVCWGESWGGSREGFEVLNGGPIINKFDAAVQLKNAGVPTIEVSRTRPANSGGRPAQPATYNGEFSFINATRDQVRTRVTELQNWLSTARDVPAVSGVEWLGRANNHVGGRDLLIPTRNPDYYSRKEELTNEFRIHCFKGKSIRAGRKVQGVDGIPQSHAWIRSLEGGWRISYDGFESTKAMRKLAGDALKALNLDFGAVDIGQKADGSLIVLEVNRAPGLEGNTVGVYAGAIQAWVNGEYREVETRAARPNRRAA